MHSSLGPNPGPSSTPCHDQERTARRGRQSYYAGVAAEETIADHYRRSGHTIIAQRKRTPYGELDLIVRNGDVTVFVEVKRRKHSLGPDSPISNRQWQRLESAALHCIVEEFEVTRVHPVCRFDVAFVGADGSYRIIENARMFGD